jgi:hypothetical protein
MPRPQKDPAVRQRRSRAAVAENDRRALAEALFARIRVLGVRRAIIEPTSKAVDRGIPAAFGLDEVEMVGARGVAPS